MKKPKGGALTADEIARNTAISSDRVLVENYFGRMCRLWNIVYATFKWNESSFDRVSRLCVALTNFHAELMPLRAQDGEHYGRVLAKYQSMGVQRSTQRASSQREYRIRQRVRAAPYAGRNQFDDEETQY